jgi:hypothetical protein
MKRLKGGPELKMPELKMPPFLVDLYLDLRDRRLLPLVAFVVVAIIAVPFLLKSGSEPVSSATAGLGAPPSPESHPASLTVVESQPGLRDYRKRLRDDSPTDPFVQRFTGPELKGTKLGGGEEGGSTTSSTSESTTTTVTKSGGDSNGGSTTTTQTTHTTSESGTGAPNSESGNSGGGSGEEPELTLFAFAVDVKMVRTHVVNGKKQTDEPVIRKHVVPPAALPSEKTQAVTYLGLSPKTRQPFFLVSDEVSSIFGEGSCLSGASTCQLIELEPSFPETFVLGEGATRYKITVLKTYPVVTGHS